MTTEMSGRPMSWRMALFLRDTASEGSILVRRSRGSHRPTCSSGLRCRGIAVESGPFVTTSLQRRRYGAGPGGRVVRYVIMIYSNPATWVHPMFLHQHEPLAPEERAAQLNEFGALLKEIAESGEL